MIRSNHNVKKITLKKWIVKVSSMNNTNEWCTKPLRIRFNYWVSEWKNVKLFGMSFICLRFNLCIHISKRTQMQIFLITTCLFFSTEFRGNRLKLNSEKKMVWWKWNGTVWIHHFIHTFCKISLNTFSFFCLYFLFVFAYHFGRHSLHIDLHKFFAFVMLV